MERKECVICRSTDLTLLYAMDKFPFCSHSTNEPRKSDKSDTLSFLACSACSTVQVGTLIEPNELYSVSHNLTFNTPTWMKHHSEFSKFIFNGTSYDKYIEIGGSSGALAKEILTNHDVSYCILDLCNTPPDISGISFIHANCETFTYESKSTLILSHVFEHLYNPRTFVSNIAESNVQTVFISIPDMEDWLNRGVLSFLFREHTFYCDKETLTFLFETFGYACTELMNFKSHSIFYKFEKINTSEPVLKARPELIQKFNRYFHLRETKLTNISVPNTISIFPAGHYGQLVHYYLDKRGIKIKYFYDNDISKQGGRLYGTDIMVRSPLTLQSSSNPETIVLCATVYRDEIAKGLLLINPNLSIIFI